jgi:hypothetical protein
MPIHASVKPLLADGRITAQDVGRLEALARAGEVSGRDLTQLGQRYQDALDAGVGNALAKLAKDMGGSIRPQAPIANLAGAPAVLSGLVTLSSGENRRHPGVVTVQRALMALANRLEKPELMLPSWGADGDFGGETVAAVEAFQGMRGLPKTGKVDGNTARALDAALRGTNVPVVFGPNNLGPTGADMVKAAEFLIAEHGNHYGVDQAWFNLDPNHSLPANVPLGGLKGKWKCNLFACNTVYKAGFEPPYYGNRGRGEYPNANQLFKWSDKYAAKYGNKTHFKLVDELAIQSLEEVSGPERVKERLTALLRRAEPGDMIIVDHRGDEVADGGHCRVVMSNGMTEGGDGNIPCAQASRASGQIRDEELYKFTGEEKIWVLRPNKPRKA